ncbi:MAG: prolyl oligopeptidase family serine peptidase [Actinomycetota bacterium]
MATEPEIITYGEHPDQFVEVWSPPATDPTPGTAVLVHGGYWRHRYALDLMHPLAASLAADGWLTVNIEYRRIEDTHGVWGRMSADVHAALALAADLADRGSDGPTASRGEARGHRPLVAIGHSAGGHLALWGATRERRIDGVVALAPVADLVEADRRNLSDGAVRELLGADSATAPELYAAASPAALLPLDVAQLVVHGHADDSVPLDLVEDYVAAATAAGDDVTLVSPTDVDHFHIIDPTHAVWSAVENQLAAWTNQAAGRPHTE